MKKPPAPIRRVGIVVNSERPQALKLARRAVRQLQRLKYSVLCDAGAAADLGGDTASVETLSGLAQVSDLLLVVGGDGTILRVAREVAGLPAPILGINAGHLGFLTDVPAHRMAEALRRVAAGRYRVEQRSLLQAEVSCGGVPSTQSALNDFVISRGGTSRLIELEVRVNDDLLTRYRCDGLIASSPTGSTAYSLAAGGAIVSPDAEVLILTPICPHTLGLRPVVVNLDAEVKVKLLTPRVAAMLTADGQPPAELAKGDTVTIRRSERTVGLLRLEGASFFATLRQKLGWGGIPV